MESKWNRDMREILDRLYGPDDGPKAEDASDEDLEHVRAELERMGLINKRGE